MSKHLHFEAVDDPLPGEGRAPGEDRASRDGYTLKELRQFKTWRLGAVVSPAAMHAVNYWRGEACSPPEEVGEREAEDQGFLVRRSSRYEPTPLALELEFLTNTGKRMAHGSRDCS